MSELVNVYAECFSVNVHYFQIVANYYGSEKVFEFETVKKIHWPNRTEPGPPPDTPVCGFDNSKCKGGK